MRQEYLLFTFDSTHAAITSQGLLKDLDAILMPTLREISASCGMSLRLRTEARDYAESRMIESGIEGWRLYRVVSEGKKPDCTLLRDAEDIIKKKGDDGNVRSED